MLIKAVIHPRLPYEIVLLGVHGEVGIVLSPSVVASARRRVQRKFPGQLPLLERFLQQRRYAHVADPAPGRIKLNQDLCRDLTDVPVALAAIDAGVDYLVTNDRDLTVVDASTARLRTLVKIITPLALLRHVLGWPEARIEAAIHRDWHELSPAEWQELEGE